MKDKINEILREYRDNSGAKAALERLLEIDSKEVLRSAAKDAAQDMEGPGTYERLIAEVDHGVVTGTLEIYPNMVNAAWVLGLNRGTFLKKRLAAGMPVRKRSTRKPKGEVSGHTKP